MDAVEDMGRTLHQNASRTGCSQTSDDATTAPRRIDRPRTLWLRARVARWHLSPCRTAADAPSLRGLQRSLRGLRRSRCAPLFS